jgi:uncharacterized protein DUF1552
VTSKFRLSRRTFLRGIAGGAAISFGLPPLEAMFNGNGTLLANGGSIPKRFGVWFWGNGIRRSEWIPDTPGPGWEAKPETQPLVSPPGLKAYLSPVTGMEIKTDSHPHHSGMAGIMTGAKYYLVGPVRDTIISTFAYPSIDQVVAERWMSDPASRTPFRSLEVGICRFRGSDEGTTFQHLSHNGPNNPNPAEYEPIRLFNRLFGMPPSAQLLTARTSLIDAVKGDLASLKARVSLADKMRLDQHLESVRSIETRLGMSGARCTTPARPADAYPDDMGNEPIEAKNQVMSDILAMALACDLSRVFSVLFSTAGAGTVFWEVGARDGLHQIAHTEQASGPELQPTLHAATTFTMQQLAYFLSRLQATPEGAGNILDSAAILCCTELSEGFTHTNDEFPVLVAGKAGGALKGGWHYRSPNKENTSNVLLTLLRAIGDTRPTFGVDGGQTSQVISDIMA